MYNQLYTSRRSEEKMKTTMNRSKVEFESVLSTKMSPNERVDSFRKLSKIGEGAFGKVYLVAHKSTQQTYAMKTIKKVSESISFVKLFKFYF